MQHSSVFRRTLNLSHLEGGLYALMVASIENFLFYYAVSIKVSAIELSLIATLPLLLGALGQYILPNFVTEKGLGPFVILTMFFQVIGVVGITAHAYMQLPFYFLLISVILFYLGGMSSTPLWIDWAQNLIPKRNFSQFMARRSSYTWYLILLFFVLFALLNRYFQLPLSIIFTIGAVARILSGFLQIYIQNGVYLKEKSQKLKHQKWIHSLSLHEMKTKFFSFEELKDFGRNLKNTFIIFLIFTALFKFGVQIGGPFFVDYMVNELKLDMFWFVILFSIPSLGRALFFKRWSRLSHNRTVFQAITFQMSYIALLPIIWTISGSLNFLIPMEILAGIFWGGFEYSSVMFIQNNLGKNSRKYIGLNMAFGSLFGLLGALLGAELKNMGFSFNQLMYASSAGRYLVWILLILALYFIPSYGKLTFKRIKKMFSLCFS